MCVQLVLTQPQQSVKCVLLSEVHINQLIELENGLTRCAVNGFLRSMSRSKRKGTQPCA